MSRLCASAVQQALSINKLYMCLKRKGWFVNFGLKCMMDCLHAVCNEALKLKCIEHQALSFVIWTGII